MFFEQSAGMNVAASAKLLNQKYVQQKWHYFCDPGLAFTDHFYDRFLATWREKTGAHKMPRRSQMTPRDLKDVLRNIALFERIGQNPSSYMFRLIGTGLTEIAGHVTGKTFEESGGQGGPLMHVIAGKAVAFQEAAAPEFKEYSAQILVNAKRLAAALAERGFRIVSGGTDVHLFLLSLVDRDTTGKAAQIALDRAGITANKNMVPYDPRKPAVTSGVRIGTPAVTTRGMREAEMERIAGLVARVLTHPGDVEELDRVRAEVEELCRSFPLYPARWDRQA